jgi:hypothetical protein
MLRHARYGAAGAIVVLAMIEQEIPRSGVAESRYDRAFSESMQNPAGHPRLEDRKIKAPVRAMNVAECR